MHTFRHNYRSFAVFIAGLCLGALTLLPLLGWTFLTIHHLRHENYALRVNIQVAIPQQVESRQVGSSGVETSSIQVNVTGTSNTLVFDYEETDSAAPNDNASDRSSAATVYNISGVDDSTRVYLKAGQTAQVTISGVDNTIRIPPALRGRVFCTDSGTSNSVVVEP